jgi:cytidylate kinase
MTFHPVIAIDGPAASGKSTVARTLAHQLGFTFVSSGHLYRAATWVALQWAADRNWADPGWLSHLQEPEFLATLHEKSLLLVFQGRELTTELEGSAVNDAVSEIAALPTVRDWATGCFHRFAAAESLVIEGRDIGSVVFPQTPHKFYLDADPAIREQRRQAQGIGDAIARRDELDSTREAAPLRVPIGATLIDNSSLSLAETVDLILQSINQRGRAV